MKASETNTSQNQGAATDYIVRIKDVGAVEQVCRSKNKLTKTSKQDTKIEVVCTPPWENKWLGLKFLVPVMVMLQSLIG